MNLTKGIKKYLLNTYLKRQEKKINATYEPEHTTQVGAFYDQYNDKFLEIYGEVIQAYRTHNLVHLLDYQISQIGLESNQKVLDAGCGVCGPAIHFAKSTGCDIEGITISEKQASIAEAKIEEHQLSDKVKVQVGDFHLIDEMFSNNTFDRVYFLESFGHSNNKRKLLQAVRKVLKPGGEVYIKDLFVRKIQYPLLQKQIYKEIDKINAAYHYQVTELSELVDLARELGFVISFIKTIDIALEDFENLAISNEWQELTGIAQIKNWDNYIFPVDFFEVKLYKLEYDQEKGKHRYFIQNLFQIKINQLPSDELGY